MSHKKQFQEIKDNYYKKIVDKIFIHFPELVDKSDLDDSPYYNINKFYIFFMDNSNDPNIYDRGIKFINESLELGKHETENLIVIEIFHPIYEDFLLVEKMKQDLIGNALDIFIKEYHIVKSDV